MNSPKLGAPTMKADRSKEDPVKLITAFFETSPQQAFTVDQLFELYNEHSREWNISIHTGPGYLFDIIEESGLLAQKELKFKDRTCELFITPKATIYDVSKCIQEDLVFSHQSAAFLHGLIDNKLKDVYLTERKRFRDDGREVYLEQAAIDAAMQQPQRVSNNKAKYGSSTIHIISSKTPFSLPAEVLRKRGRDFNVTSIEQLLIDIIVRPGYCVDPQTVLTVYQNAKERVDVPKAIAALKKMKHIYPYHQVMGFYMQKAGYDPNLYQALKDIPRDFDFYVDRQMTNPHYNREWRVYHPRGL